MSANEFQKIGFGGGCHWCTEAVFQSLRGVSQVEQGWIAEAGDEQAYSEAVVVSFDPSTISLGVLIEIHLRTHSSSSNHSMRAKYRSAVYAFDKPQLIESKSLLKQLKCKFEKGIVTQALMFGGFKENDEKYQNYYQQDPERSFCKTYIDPKLTLLREEFAAHVCASD